MTFAYLLLGALFGYAGYREAANFERKHGRSPWGLSPIGWGAVVFFTGLLIGGVLLMIARRRTLREIERAPAFATAPTPQPFAPAAFSTAPFATAPASPVGPVVTDPSNPYAPPVATAPVQGRPHPGSMDILPG